MNTMIYAWLVRPALGTSRRPLQDGHRGSLPQPWRHALILAFLASILLASGATRAAIVWTGSHITFSKANNADSGQAVNQDRITSNVWLTRGTTMGLYNAKTESGYASSSPADTEWAYGTTADYATLTYHPWVVWHQKCPPCAAGMNAVLHLISDDIYLDIKVTSWQSSGGGGFAYERSTPGATPPPPPPTTPAVEYYYADWDYYFVTSFPDEIALLDGGAFNGNWKRTGQTFNVWPQATSTSSPTCRFFSTPLISTVKSSHFYTPFPAECDTVKQNPNWEFESIAFYIQLAQADGTCSGGTIPLYRLYNNGMGGAPNHRYTTSLTILNQMVAAGWVFEGDGNTKVFACVPP